MSFATLNHCLRHRIPRIERPSRHFSHFGYQLSPPMDSVPVRLQVSCKLANGHVFAAKCRLCASCENRCRPFARLESLPASCATCSPETGATKIAFRTSHISTDRGRPPSLGFGIIDSRNSHSDRVRLLEYALLIALMGAVCDIHSLCPESFFYSPFTFSNIL